MALAGWQFCQVVPVEKRGAAKASERCLSTDSDSPKRCLAVPTQTVITRFPSRHLYCTLFIGLGDVHHSSIDV